MKLKARNNIRIDGKKLILLRIELNKTQEEIAEGFELARTRISQLEKQGSDTSVRRDRIEKLAKYLGFTYENLIERIGILEKKTGAHWACGEPCFDIKVAAGGWVSNMEIGRVKDESQAAKGVFWIRIEGDSMAPAYNSGESIKFRSLANGGEGILPGKDYYVHRSDDCATFKRVLKVEGEVVTLVAVNAKKYPKPLTVSLQEIVQMARAIGRYIET